MTQPMRAGEAHSRYLIFMRQSFAVVGKVILVWGPQAVSVRLPLCLATQDGSRFREETTGRSRDRRHYGEQHRGWWRTKPLVRLTSECPGVKRVLQGVSLFDSQCDDLLCLQPGAAQTPVPDEHRILDINLRQSLDQARLNLYSGLNNKGSLRRR